MGAHGPDTVGLDPGAVLLELSGSYGSFVNRLHFGSRLATTSLTHMCTPPWQKQV